VDAVVEAPASGIIAELLVEEGADVPVGTVIARLS
jgi:pyruvate/2-oxoglutarate dehydrogenase complex dihydrolipoamide acyltransferase (E2) component